MRLDGLIPATVLPMTAGGAIDEPGLRRYVRWIASFRRCAVLTLDIREYDLLHDPEAAEDIGARVRLRLEGELPQTELWPARVRHAV